MTGTLLLCCAFVVHSVWVHIMLRNIRKDLLSVAKNPRAARNDLLKKHAYKNLD